jgi:large subunit ribosomal protein L17
MKHRVFGRKLSRDKNERKALFKNLVSSLILQGSIKTTEAKAKAIRGLMEKLVTRARLNTLAARRTAEAFLQDKSLVNKLLDEIAPKFVGRSGGYTRMIKLNTRIGDRAKMVKMEFVEKVEPGTFAPVKVKAEPVVKALPTKAEKKHAVLIKPTKKLVKKEVKEKKTK